MLDRGRVSFEGDPEELSGEERLREAYFGRRDEGDTPPAQPSSQLSQRGG